MEIDWNDIINKDNIIPEGYIIYKEGDKFYARNGKYGTIDFKGAEAAIVTQSAINNMAGGDLYIKKADYQIAKSLNLLDNTSLIAECGAKFVLNQGKSINILGKNNVEILNLSVDSSAHNVNNYGIYIEDSKNIIIDKVKEISKGFGIYITGNKLTDGVTIKDCVLNGLGNNDVIGGGPAIQGSSLINNIIITNNIINQDATKGNLYDATIDMVGAYRTTFLNNFTKGTVLFGNEKYPNVYSTISGNIIKPADGKNETGIAAYTTVGADKTAKNLSFTNNTIENGVISIVGVNTAYDLKGLINNNIVSSAGGLGINLKYCSQFVITGNIISNASIGINLDNSTLINIIGNIITDSYTGIDGNSNSYYNLISNNIIEHVANKILRISSTSRIFNNVGYKTENNILSDIFNIDNTGIKTITIPHGLDITPAVQNCCLTIVQDTAVDDWSFNLLEIKSVDIKNVIAKINVSIASTTGGATARLALKVGNS